MISDLETTAYLNKKRSRSIRDLYHEHDKEIWFEDFKDRYRDQRGIPKLFEWYNIRLNDLPEFLCTEKSQKTKNYQTLSKLVNKGFITPRENKFIDNSPTNFVNVQRLSQLLAQLCYKESKQILKKEDDYFNAVVKSYLHNRLIPFLIRHRIKKFRKVPFKEAANLIDTNERNLRRFVNIHNQINPEYKKNNGIIFGIDLAIYSMRPRTNNPYKEEDLINLFALTDIDTQRLRLFQNEDRKFSTGSYILPFYESVAQKARKLIKAQDPQYDHLTLTPLQVRKKVNGTDNVTTYYLTPEAKIAYCHAHDLTEFDKRCERFIEDNIKNGVRKNGKITSQLLILTLRKDNRIISAKSNIQSYSNPHDDELTPEAIEKKQRKINKTNHEGKIDSRGIGRAGLNEIPENLLYQSDGSRYLTKMQQYTRE